MIRNATHNDVERMVELGALMHVESKFRAYSFDPWKVEVQIRTLIDSPTGIAIVAEIEGQVVGGFIGVVIPHFFGHDLAAYDLALFLAPEHRAGTTGARLLKQYIQQAKELGAAEVVMANATGYKKESVARLFESIGFTQDGYVFSMNLKGAQACA